MTTELTELLDAFAEFTDAIDSRLKAARVEIRNDLLLELQRELPAGTPESKAVETVIQKGESGRDGKDGVNGADGTDGVNGEHGKDGKDGRDGRDGKDGIASTDQIQAIASKAVDDRLEAVVQKRVADHVATLPIPKYRPDYKVGKAYQPGDLVSWAGQAWIATEETSAKPGDGKGWDLFVRRGRDAK